MSGRQVVDHSVLLAAAREAFGPDPKLWRFRCVSCGTVQSGADFEALGLSREAWETRVFFACIGRVKGAKRGCDWTLGGLLRIHRLEVRMSDGTTTPSFELALPEAEGGAA